MDARAGIQVKPGTKELLVSRTFLIVPWIETNYSVFNEIVLLR